jgi:hypothetical protein
VPRLRMEKGDGTFRSVDMHGNAAHAGLRGGDSPVLIEFSLEELPGSRGNDAVRQNSQADTGMCGMSLSSVTGYSRTRTPVAL